MTLELTAHCNQCGELKKESNHWFVGFRLVERSGPKFREQRVCGFKVMKWSTTRATQDDSVHLCGPGCAQKFSNQVMEEMAKAPQRAVPMEESNVNVND